MDEHHFGLYRLDLLADHGPEYVRLFALTSTMMSFCVTISAQQPQSTSYEEMLEMIRQEPGWEIDQDGNITVNGKPMRTPRKLVRNEYIMVIEPLSESSAPNPKDKKYPHNIKPSKVPEGITLKELLSELPGVQTDKDGKLVTKKGKKQIVGVKFNEYTVYPVNRNTAYTDDYKLCEGTVLVQIMDSKFYEEVFWLKAPDNLTEDTAIIDIRYYPEEDVEKVLLHRIYG